MTSDLIHQARVDLAAIFRWAARLGMHEGICNHFSYAVDEDRFLVNPRGYHWSELTASHLLLVTHETQVVEGQGEVEPTALFIHSRIHTHCPQARCVLHTHMPHATAIASTRGGRLLMASQNAMRFYDDICYDDDYQGLALDSDEGDRICRALGDRHVAFLANHGVVVVAETIVKAFDDLYYLERACYIQILVQSTGGALNVVEDRIAEHVAKQFAGEAQQTAEHLAAIKRILDREEPDYAS